MMEPGWNFIPGKTLIFETVLERKTGTMKETL